MRKCVYLSGLLLVCFSLFTNTASAQAPVVTTEPTGDTVCTGSTVMMRVAATGTAPITFMWEFSADGGVMWDTVENGAVYTGASNDTLSVLTSTALNGMHYRCLLFNADGSDTTMSAALGVDTAFAGVISGPARLCDGSTVTFTSSVLGGIWSNVNLAVDTTSPTGMVEARAFGGDTIKYTITNTCGTITSTRLIRVDTTVTGQPITGPTHVCVGNTIALNNVNVVGSGVWSVGVTGRSSISSTGVVTGIGAGADTVIYNFTNACSAVSSSLIIDVESVLPAGSISGASAVCAGSWTTLTSSVSGGMWISSSTPVAVVSSVGNVTGIAQGSALISYYRSNSCGASFSTHTINVEVPAGAISSNDSVGIDSFLILTNPTPGGTWSTADASIANIVGADTVRGVDTGVTTITYAVTNSCGTSSSTITMNVGPLPDAGTISGPDTVCVGGTITLTASIPGGVWTNKHDTLSSITSSGVVTGIESGRDTIFYTVNTAFGSKRILKRIFVNQPPVITVTGPATVAFAGGYYLVGIPGGGTWSTNNAAMTVFTSISSYVDAGVFKSFCNFVVLDTGSARVTYNATNGCGSSSKFFDLNLPGNVSGVADVKGANGKLNVYPNPSQGALTLNIATATTEQVVVTVANVAGQVVKTFKIASNTATNVMLDQPAGVYMLSATTADGIRHTASVSIAR